MHSACNQGAEPYLAILIGLVVLVAGVVQVFRPRWLPGGRLWRDLNDFPANAVVGSWIIVSGALWALVAIVAAMAGCQGG